MTNKLNTLPYRPCAGIMLINADNHVFVGQRMDSVSDAWQMPQGGIDPGEDAQAAAFRELEEETGVAPHLAKLLAQSSREHLYDLPPELMGRMWNGKYRGQAQTWFAMQFLGSDADVDIATDTQEFRAWRWADPADLVGLIVPFKRQLYKDVLAEFAHLL